jgi:uncharacterized protein YjbI with pentapeptide repeats
VTVLALGVAPQAANASATARIGTPLNAARLSGLIGRLCPSSTETVLDVSERGRHVPMGWADFEYADLEGALLGATELGGATSADLRGAKLDRVAARGATDAAPSTYD